MRKDPALAKEVPSVPNAFFRARYAPFLAQMVVIRRCNLSCGYCSEYDKFSDPVPAEVLEKRLLKLKELGTFGISLTGGDAPYS
jgi:MoaA/NifB/PqqE/SkfB family radical SAM enzyme